MDVYKITYALEEHDRKLHDLGAKGVYELLLSKPVVAVGDYAIGHMQVLSNTKEDYSTYRSSNYREDIYHVINPAIGEECYVKIKCEFDSWDTYEWDAVSVVEVKPQERTVIEWREV